MYLLFKKNLSVFSVQDFIFQCNFRQIYFIPSDTCTNFRIQNYKRLNQKLQTSIIHSAASLSNPRTQTYMKSFDWEMFLISPSICLNAFVPDSTQSLLFFKRQSSTRVEIICLPCNVLYNCFSLMFMQTNQLNPQELSCLQFSTTFYLFFSVQLFAIQTLS